MQTGNEFPNIFISVTLKTRNSKKSTYYCLPVCSITYLTFICARVITISLSSGGFRSFSSRALTFSVLYSVTSNISWFHFCRISLTASLPLILLSHLLLMFSTESELCQMCTETSTRKHTAAARQRFRLYVIYKYALALGSLVSIPLFSPSLHFSVCSPLFASLLLA